MAIRAAAALVEDWFIPEDQVGEDKPARFKIKSLDNIDLMRVMADGRITADGAFIPNHDGRMFILKKGLIDWEGIEDESDNPIRYSASNLGRVPAGILFDVANEILTRSFLSPEEKKA